MKNKSRKFKFLISIILCAALLVQSAVVFAADKGEDTKSNTKLVGEYIEGEAVVMLKDNAGSKFLTKSCASEAYGGDKVIKNTASFEKKNGKPLNFVTIKSKNKSTEQLISDLSNNDAVKYAVPNTIARASSITNDTYSDYQWALENKGQSGGKEGADINPETLWSSAKSASEDAIVAVLDTGIDYNHEDLKNVVWTNPFGSKLKGIHGYDFTGDNSDCSPLDNNGHGSHCAGIIAAQADNNLGISGVNKDKVKIMALKILNDEGAGTLSWIFQACSYVEQAVKLGANVKAMNCSFGYIATKNEVEMYNEVFDALGEYGVVTCIAAGNEYLTIDNIRNPGSIDYVASDAYYIPAETNSEYAITVAASNSRDELADFSNRGSCVDVAAPGTAILSTVCFNTFNPSIYSDAQRNQLCKYYQGYEGGTMPTGFGKATTYESSSTKTDESLGTGFMSENSLVLSNTATNSASILASFPYTIDNTSDYYYISFMYKTSGDITLYIDDRSAGFDTANDYADIPEYCWKFGSGSTDWSSSCLTNDASYLDSENRQFIIYAVGTGTVEIDNLAISYQGADESAYGNYEFLDGTSMATPYVAGAAALIANSRSDMDALNVVNAINTTGRYSTEIGGQIVTGRVLSLENIPSYEIIRAGNTGECKWDFDKDTATLTVTGSGAMADYNYSINQANGASVLDTPWSDIAADIKNIVIGSGVTAIGDACFAGCTNLESVTIPASVKKIGKYAFFDTHIDTIKLPNNISTIGKYAMGYIIGYNISSETYSEFKDDGCVIYAYTASKTASVLKANGYKFTSLGGLTLSKYSATIYVKGTYTIKANLKNYSAAKTYKSSNTKVATVSSAGKITAKKAGTATITVKCGDLTQTFKITVKNPKLNATSKTLKKGKTFKLKITGKIGKATFKTSNKKICTVTSAGTIKAKKKGKATITVKTNGITLKCKITVK